MKRTVKASWFWAAVLQSGSRVVIPEHSVSRRIARQYFPDKAVRLVRYVPDDDGKPAPKRRKGGKGV